jgi:hypothetical protein
VAARGPGPRFRPLSAPPKVGKHATQQGLRMRDAARRTRLAVARRIVKIGLRFSRWGNAPPEVERWMPISTFYSVQLSPRAVGEGMSAPWAGGHRRISADPRRRWAHNVSRSRCGRTFASSRCSIRPGRSRMHAGSHRAGPERGYRFARDGYAPDRRGGSRTAYVSFFGKAAQNWTIRPPEICSRRDESRSPVLAAHVPPCPAES